MLPHAVSSNWQLLCRFSSKRLFLFPASATWEPSAGNARNWTQDLIHAEQVLQHQTTLHSFIGIHGLLLCGPLPNVTAWKVFLMMSSSNPPPPILSVAVKCFQENQSFSYVARESDQGMQFNLCGSREVYSFGFHFPGWLFPAPFGERQKFPAW